MRGASIAMGLGLGALWLFGFSTHATLWLTWLVGLAALCALALGARPVPLRPVPAAASRPLVLSGGLFLLWMIGLGLRVEPWLAWWTFIFACGFLMLGIYVSARMGRPTITSRPHRV
jgi:hypothetical protein